MLELTQASVIPFELGILCAGWLDRWRRLLVAETDAATDARQCGETHKSAV